MTDTKHGRFGALVASRQALFRWIGGVLVGVAVVVLGLFVAIRVIADAEAVERRLNATLADATDGRYEMTLDAVEWGVFAQSLRVTGVTLRPDSQLYEYEDGAPPHSRRIHGAIPAIELHGIDRWSLFWRQALKLESVLVRRPRIQVRTQDLSETQSPSMSSQEDTSAGWEERPPPVQIREFRVEGGTVVRGKRGGSTRDSLWDVSLRLDSLSIDSTARALPTQFLVDHFSEGGIGGYRRVMADEPYVLRLGRSRVSRRDSILRMEDLQFMPSLTDDRFMGRHKYRVNRFRTRAARVAVAGFNYQQFVEEGQVHADRIRIDALNLDVYRDNHLPERPNDPPPPMPQDVIEELDRSLRVDTLRVRNGRLRYTKRPEGVAESGSISFDNFRASVYNLTNDPDRMTRATPAIITVQTQVNGTGRLRTTLRIPLRAPHLSLTFRGGLGAMDARTLNETFVNLGGVRIESGQVDSLWFDATVERATATGSVHGIYRNLEVETLNKRTGKRGLGNRLKTIVTGMALRSSNLPAEGELDTGRIQHTHEADESFFKFLWYALRSGIYSLVGIDRLPG